MKSKKAVVKLIIIVVLVVTAVFLIKNIMARYESSGSSVAKIETALFIINESYQTMNINLNSMIPRTEPYVHSFSISNNDGTYRTEVELEYDLQIQTTTNLPLTYELYLNQDYNDNNAQNIITENSIDTDEYGTYFKKIKTDTKKFGYNNNETNTYQLVIYFPETYKEIEYQDIIENIEIKVNAKQVI